MKTKKNDLNILCNAFAIMGKVKKWRERFFESCQEMVRHPSLSKGDICAKKVRELIHGLRNGRSVTEDKFFASLALIGAKKRWRFQFTELCREIESDFHLPVRNIREEVTGPLIDALYSRSGLLKKELSCGTVIQFKYCSKIARDFILSPEAKPDHVWEPQTTKLLLRLSKVAKHVVIGGAYFGDQAILVAKALKESRGVCHVFDLNRQQLSLLRRNARYNHLNNIRINCIGLWENDKTFLTLIGENSLAHSEPQISTFQKKANRGFATTTLNQYGQKWNVPQCDLIMLDIEGGELCALKGADNYLSQPIGRAPRIVFEIHRHYVDWSSGLENIEIIKYLKSFGYHVFAIRDFQSNYPMGDGPIELIPPTRVYLKGPPHAFNLFAIKDVEFIKNDFFRIRYDVSPKLLLHKNPLLHFPIPDK